MTDSDAHVLLALRELALHVRAAQALTAHVHHDAFGPDIFAASLPAFASGATVVFRARGEVVEVDVRRFHGLQVQSRRAAPTFPSR